MLAQDNCTGRSGEIQTLPGARHEGRIGMAAGLPRRLAAAAALAAWRSAAHGGRRPRPRRRRTAARGPVTNLPLPRFVSMRAESANARRGPSLDQRVDWEFVAPRAAARDHRRVRPVAAGARRRRRRRLGAQRAALGGADGAGPRRGAGAAAGGADRAGGGAGDGRARGGRAARGLPRAPGARSRPAGVEGWLPRAAIWGVGPDETIE